MKPIRNETVLVSTTSLEVAADLEGLEKRTDLIIRNTSPNAVDIITLSLGRNAAVANAGIVLRQNEIWMSSTDISNPAWSGAIQAICATINGQLSIMEKS